MRPKKLDINVPVKVIGLTGGVASGKSTVARILESEGFPVIDADQLARDLSSPGGKAADLIQKRFGTLDRKQLRERVFSDAAARKDLEAILHPLIRQETSARILQLARDQPTLKVIFYEAALLVETKVFQDLDGLWMVTSSPDVRKSRLMARDKIDAPLADRIVGAQLSDVERQALVPDAILISNNGTAEDLRKTVISLSQTLLSQFN